VTETPPTDPATPSAKPQRRPPPPAGWRRARRKSRKHTFNDDFPTLQLKVSFVLFVLLIALAMGAIFVLPAVLWFLEQTNLLAWDLSFEVLELLGIALGVPLLYVVYILDPVSLRKSEKSKTANAPAADTPEP
jgi:hypothetical protein